MKKNTFYLLVGCIATAFVALFAWATEVRNPMVVEVAFVVACSICVEDLDI